MQGMANLRWVVASLPGFHEAIAWAQRELIEEQSSAE
jgi:hypothetical protein